MARKLSDISSGNTVKINENKIGAEYLVFHQGKPASGNYDSSCEGTWLCRKEIHSKKAWKTPANNDYANGINIWLNNDFLQSLDEDIAGAIKQVKIPYRKGDGLSTTVQSGSNGLSCKVFLLSMRELGYDNSNESFPYEGAPFGYFSDNISKIARYDGQITEWWLRTPYCGNHDNYVCYVEANGLLGVTDSDYVYGIRPVFILPSNLNIDDNDFVIVNQPPTAPGSIDVANVGSSGTITITLTAATDPDGTVESYIYERQVDGGAWEQVAQANSLTQTDAIGEEWGTVAYRACAVDDKGVSGPYVTSETFTVNSGWTIISGPAEDMGSQPAPFDFDFSASVSGVSSVDAITVSAALDGVRVYSGTPNAGEQVTIPIKTQLLGAGTHTVEVQASKDDYLPASKRYTFTVPAVTIPDGGVGALAQVPDGRAVYHTTLAQRCIGTGGVDIQAQIDALTARVKTLEG